MFKKYTPVELKKMAKVKSFSPMRKGAKKAWIKALRSGYLQGAGKLSRPNGEFCVLGVLCHATKTLPESNYGLSSKELKKFGLSAVIADRMIWLNDTKQASFESLAKFIDKYL